MSSEVDSFLENEELVQQSYLDLKQSRKINLKRSDSADKKAKSDRDKINKQNVINNKKINLFRVIDNYT